MMQRLKILKVNVTAIKLVLLLLYLALHDSTNVVLKLLIHRDCTNFNLFKVVFYILILIIFQVKLHFF